MQVFSSKNFEKMQNLHKGKKKGKVLRKEMLS